MMEIRELMPVSLGLRLVDVKQIEMMLGLVWDYLSWLKCSSELDLVLE